MRHFFCALTCLLSLAFSFSTPAFASDSPDTVTLRLTTAYMDRHPAYVNVFVPWTKKLAELTNDSLLVRYFNPNTICPEAGMLDAVAAGAVDIAANAHGRTPGRFPLMSVMDLPMLAPNAEVGSVISQRLYEKHPELQQEATSVRMLWHYVSSPHVLHTKKPVTRLEDLKGMKIVAWAPLAVDILRALGANPIQAVPHESYLAVQRGMADGVLCPISTLRSFKISEAVGHTNTAPLMVDSFWVAISPSRWNTLTPDQQNALESTLPDMARVTGAAQDAGAAAEAAILTEQGHTFHQLPPEELARWQQALEPIYDQWLKTAPANGAALLKEVKEMIAASK